MNFHDAILSDIARFLFWGYAPGGGAMSCLTSAKPVCISGLYKRTGSYAGQSTYKLDPDNHQVWQNTLAILRRNSLLNGLTWEEVRDWQGFDNENNDVVRTKMLLKIVDYDLFRELAPYDYKYDDDNA